MGCPLKFGDVFRICSSHDRVNLKLEKLDGTIIEIDTGMFRTINMAGFIGPANDAAKILFGDK